jgi:hypothetical protein
VWTVVNRGGTDYEGPVLALDAAGTWVEAAGGAPVSVSASGGTVGTRVPARGIACLLRASGASGELPSLPAPVPPSGDTIFPARPMRSVSEVRESAAASAADASAADAVPAVAADAVVVGPGRRSVTVRYRRRETGQRDETPWVDAWKPLPPDLHVLVTERREAELGHVAVDGREVSNGEFAAFLAATGYRPQIGHRFLATWVDGRPAAGTEEQPVVHVSLDDARAYARWRGARLPSPEEWQAAVEDGALRRAPAVWNWTDSEHTDGVTRYAILKGGSWFAARGSDWYVDGGQQPPEWELKLVLPGAGLDRSECVGFRCAVEL